MKYLRDLVLFYRPLLFCILIVFLSASGAYAAQPVPPAGPNAPEMQSLAGKGEFFEVVLKFPSVVVGSEVPLTAYVLDGTTNEPVRGATVSGGLSSGTESISVPFTETAQPTAGAYQGKIRGEESDEASSWLFDITLDDKSDLVAIDGFKTGDKSTGTSAPAPPGVEKSGYEISLTPAKVGVLLLAFALLQAAIFLFIRKRCTSAASAKELR